MKITRRETLARGGQAVAATSPDSGDVSPCGDPDAELIALGRQHQDWWAHMCRLVKEEDRLLSAGTDAERSEIAAQVSQGWDKSSEMERRIAAIPANTFAGIAIKLRIATEDMNEEDMRRPTNANLESALADAERLAGMGDMTAPPENHADAKLLALEAEIVNEQADWKAGKVKDDEAEEHGERVSDMDQRFAEMPVHTLSGVAAKLRHLRRALVDDGTVRTRDILVVETSLAAVEQGSKAVVAS